MLKKLFAAAVCAVMVSSVAEAQKGFATYLFPEFWEGEQSLNIDSECNKVEGDFNKDGINDLAVIALPKDPTHMRTRDDGYVYNFNKRVLAIYFGGQDGKLKRFKEYNNTIPGDDEENEDCSHEIDMSVNAKGVIRISVGMFCSAGGADVPKTEYVYRYQNNDFFLIGKDYGSFSRYSGEAEKVSENYLTHKKQTITYNMLDEGDEKEKWTTLPSKPLEKLGAKLLEPFSE